MTLNNKGWGYRAMFFLITILLIFFILALILIYRFYSSFEIVDNDIKQMEVIK